MDQMCELKSKPVCLAHKAVDWFNDLISKLQAKYGLNPGQNQFSLLAEYVVL
jgi:hypothetical protein